MQGDRNKHNTGALRAWAHSADSNSTEIGIICPPPCSAIQECTWAGRQRPVGCSAALWHPTAAQSCETGKMGKGRETEGTLGSHLFFLRTKSACERLTKYTTGLVVMRLRSDIGVKRF